MQRSCHHPAIELVCECKHGAAAFACWAMDWEGESGFVTLHGPPPCPSSWRSLSMSAVFRGQSNSYEVSNWPRN
jgi:hypothetical protein